MRNKGKKGLPKVNCSKYDPVQVRSKTDVKALKTKFPHVWRMTSRNFHADSNARLDSVRSHIKDFVTIKSFSDAIKFNRHLISGKVVLVLHCGQELVFPLMAAKIGASHVYAVDSSFAIEYLQAVVGASKFSDRITILQGRIQDIKLPVKQVDVIICNWMGYSLFFDWSCESVIYARDKWLQKETGVIFPDKAMLYVAGIQNSKNKNERVNWWHDVHGFNMKSLRKMVLEAPIIQKIDPSQLLTAPVKIWEIDMYHATVDSLKFRTPLSIDILRGGCLEGIVTYFDAHFSKSHTPMILETSPSSPQTNWLQSVFYFNEPLTVNANEQFLSGIVMFTEKKLNCKVTNVILELFADNAEDLSLILKMNWSSSQLTESITEVDAVCTTKQNKKKTKETPVKKAPD